MLLRKNATADSRKPYLGINRRSRRFASRPPEVGVLSVTYPPVNLWRKKRKEYVEVAPLAGSLVVLRATSPHQAPGSPRTPNLRGRRRPSLCACRPTAERSRVITGTGGHVFRFL